jgi:uncharacterized protein
MQLAKDSETAAWLESLGGVPEDFEWNKGNQTKSRKHGVEPTHVEEILRHPILFAGRIIEPAHDEPRWLLLGRDDRGRALALIFTRRRDRLRPVSCRPMRRKEKKLYEEAVEDIENGP